MKPIEKGVYSAAIEKVMRAGELVKIFGIWHDCKKYKDNRSARVQLLTVKENKDFKCPWCDFKYSM